MKRRLFIRVHAARRMLERNISIDEIEMVVEAGEIIEDYPEDEPFPSWLLLGWPQSRPLHVVAADETDSTSPTSSPLTSLIPTSGMTPSNGGQNDLYRL